MADSERQDLLDCYSELRVADVRDGLDWLMRHGAGSMEPAIRPLWRTRAVGLAKTARYLPYKDSVPNMTPGEYSEWVSWYCREVCYSNPSSRLFRQMTSRMVRSFRESGR